MTAARFIIGDVFDALATLEANSVDLIMSSPPFLALRSYLPADHPDKGKEIGSEATPADFLDTLLDVVEACDRVLAPHGSLVFELGDTFSGSGGAGGDYAEGGLRDGQNRADGSARRLRDSGAVANYSDQRGNPAGMRDTTFSGANTRTGGGRGWPLDKSLCGIPTLFAWSLAYGRNLLRPERQTPQWRIRNIVVWSRPNPPVGALSDKFRPATSYLTVATKARDRYFDLEAVRGPASPNTHARTAQGVASLERSGKSAERDGNWASMPELAETAGAPPLDYWVIPTHAFKGAHYAAFPPKLCRVPIESMCPRRVCTVCGKPSRRITEDTPELAEAKAAFKWESGGLERGLKKDAATRVDVSGTRRTVGWTDCSHNAWRTGVVLDPFGGSGTVGEVATGLGRDAVLIDLNEANAELALERVGPLLLTVEHAKRETPNVAV